MCLVFLILQMTGAEYKNWQQEPRIRRYIQIASINALISFIGFTLTFWPTIGLLTPVFVISQFVFAISILTILLAIKDLIY
jgi:hypothetical protein